MKIICTKCGSNRVDNFSKEAPKEQVLTMDEWVKETTGSRIVPAIMHYTTMVLLCKDCGYRKEYTTP